MYFKNFFLVNLFLVISISAKAQDNSSEQSSAYRNFYLDLSSGIDNHTGILGIGAFIPFNQQLGLRLGAGIGGWGGKLSAGLKFQDLTQSGFGFGLGYSHCSGLQDFDLTLEDSNGGSRTVNVSLNPVGSVNFTINKNFIIREGMLFYIETGYAVGTGRSDFYEVNDGSTLNDDEELIMEILRPGGLILALGLSIGF